MCSFLGSVECTSFCIYFKERGMKVLDLARLSAAEDLAVDEVLLDLCEEGAGDEVLRFWEPSSPFVVLGHSSSVNEDVLAEACEARGIPILRRHSGGGTVLQMPGCLNYSLVLRIDGRGDLETITGTNAFVMSRVCRALQKIAEAEVRVDGQTDLVLGGRKFCGNAQRRRLRSVLFHGVLLLSADITLVAAALKIPPRQPLYRNNRTHEEFLVNAGWAAEHVKRELCGEWNAGELLTSVPGERVEELVRTKYATREWTYQR
jgi:lipoate---protein ligase